jgi:hypothetical protein
VATQVVVVHLCALDSAILDDSSATRRLSKNGVVGSQSSSEWVVGKPSLMTLRKEYPR